jgi:hypothetical protein
VLDQLGVVWAGLHLLVQRHYLSQDRVQLIVGTCDKLVNVQGVAISQGCGLGDDGVFEVNFRNLGFHFFLLKKVSMFPC